MGKLLVDANETPEEHHVDVVEAFWILGTKTLSLRDPKLHAYRFPFGRGVKNYPDSDTALKRTNLQLWAFGRSAPCDVLEPLEAAPSRPSARRP